MHVCTIMMNKLTLRHVLPSGGDYNGLRLYARSLCAAHTVFKDTKKRCLAAAAFTLLVSRAFFRAVVTLDRSFHQSQAFLRGNWGAASTLVELQGSNDDFQGTQIVLFFMFPDARFQSKTNEKLTCCLEHLSIDVVKLRLSLYGLNIKIHQSPVCDMCQIARFSRHSKRAIFHVS